jgi:hypothetical protein
MTATFRSILHGDKESHPKEVHRQLVGLSFQQLVKQLFVHLMVVSPSLNDGNS